MSKFDFLEDALKTAGGKNQLLTQVVDLVRSGTPEARAAASELVQEMSKRGFTPTAKAMSEVGTFGKTTHIDVPMEGITANTKQAYTGGASSPGIKVVDTAPKETVNYILPSEQNKKFFDSTSLAPSKGPNTEVGFGRVMDAVDRVTGRPLRNAANALFTGEDVGEAVKEGAIGEKNVEGTELARKLLSQMSEMGMVPGATNVASPLTGEVSKKHLLEEPAGMLIENALDVTNLIPSAKAGKIASKISPEQAKRVLSDLIENVSKSGQKISGREVISAAQPHLSGNVLKDMGTINQAAMEMKAKSPLIDQDRIKEFLASQYPDMKAPVEFGDTVRYGERKRLADLMDKNNTRVSGQEFVENPDFAGYQGLALSNKEGKAGMGIVDTGLSKNAKDQNKQLASTAAHETQHLREFDKYNIDKLGGGELRPEKISNPKDVRQSLLESSQLHHQDYPVSFELQNSAELVNDLGLSDVERKRKALQGMME